MLKMCELRNDEWGFEVLGHLKTFGDLHAAEARYHVRCYLYFSTFLHKPSPSVSPIYAVGRTVSSEMLSYFDTVCEWAENGDCELFTVRELHEEMVELAGDPSKVYCIRYVKDLLVKRYGEQIFFASICGRTDVVCFRNMASHILNWVPPLLNLFLQGLVSDELKQIAFGHSIVQSSRPCSVVSPVLFGV